MAAMLKKCSEKQFVCIFLFACKMFWYWGILNFLVIHKLMSPTFLYQDGGDIYILTTKKYEFVRTMDIYAN